MEAISPEVGEALGFSGNSSCMTWILQKTRYLWHIQLNCRLTALPIFMTTEAACYDIFTVVHEFGHFNSVYHDDTPALYTNINMDVSEIHSQGLELLFYPYYEQMYPEGSAMQLRSV